MAPRTEHHATRRGGRSGRARRNRHNSYTSAGINSSCPYAGSRRGFGWPQYRDGGGQRQAHPRNPLPPGGRLVDRMTVDDDQRRRTRAQDVREHQAQLRPRLQDRITHGHDGGGAVAFYGSNDASSIAFPRSQGQGLVTRMTRDVNDDFIAGTNVHGSSFTSTAQQASAFHASQLHQVLPENQRPLFPVIAPGRYAIFARAQARNPIRMTNEVPANRPAVPTIGDTGNIEYTSPKRPINTYRGKDPIKRMMQNPNLRAVLSGKPYPQQRKKSGVEKPVLRMGMSRTTK